MKRKPIQPSGPITATIRPPGSKSITNRALICAALAEGDSRLLGALDSEDTVVMLDALQALGLDVEHNTRTHEVSVRGGGGTMPVRQADLFVANSGTTMRFLTAALTACHGNYRLDGIERMRERPIADLLSALRTLGGNANSENDSDCPPVRIKADGLRGGQANIRGEISSQFLSGLLMAAPYARADVDVQVEGELVSRPYVDMTLSVMRAFGVTADEPKKQTFHIPAPQLYLGTDYEIEPDASAASYFWAAAAISSGDVTVEGLHKSALQGDVGFCDCLEQMGCRVIETENGIRVVGQELHGIQVDMNEISDTVQTLAAVALFAEGPTHISGVAHIRHKETDRIGDLACELRKLGADVTEHDDGLTIQPTKLRAAEINTYNDHRMAMSLALVGLKIPGVVILDPDCTRKTYPNFFQDLDRVTNGG